MTAYDNPLIVQSDRTVLLEVAAPRAREARAALARFAELEKSPEHAHVPDQRVVALERRVRRVTPDDVAATLDGFAKYPAPPSLVVDVREEMSRHGRLRLVRDFDSGGLALTTDEVALLEEVARDREVATLLGPRLDGNRYAVRLGDRGLLKQALLRLGWPPADEAGYTEGAGLDLDLICELRGYQGESVASWWADGSAAGGSGVDKTTLTADDVGEYSGDRKQIRSPPPSAPRSASTCQTTPGWPTRSHRRRSATAWPRPRRRSRSDNRRPEAGFFHPARGTRPEYHRCNSN